MLVEAQGAEAQLRGLAQQVEQLGGEEAEVAVVQAAQVVARVARAVGERQAAQRLLQALPLGLGGVQRLAQVLAHVAGAEVGDGEVVGVAADALAVHGAVVAGIVQRALQRGLEGAHQVLELAHEARELGRLCSAGGGVALEGGHGHRGRQGEAAGEGSRLGRGAQGRGRPSSRRAERP